MSAAAMNVGDVMVEDVVTLRPGTSVREIARVLADNLISAAPVTDEHGAVIGMVSEGDLMRRAEMATASRRPWWLELFTSSQVLAAEYMKSSGREARDVMTAPVVTVGETASLAEAAALMEQHHVKRLPVLRDGRLVGIVSRADLVSALAAAAPAPAARSGDRAAREAFLAAVRAQPWGRAARLHAWVRHGTLHVRGTVGSREEKRAVEIAGENTPGIARVRAHIAVLEPLPPL